MGWLLKLLGGSLGPYLAGAVGVLLAGSLATAAVQGWRLDHAKKDLTEARAALKDPVTGKKWKDLAVSRQRDLDQCRGNNKTLTDSLGRQNAAVDLWKAEAAARTADAAKAALDARSARAVAESRARDLAALKSASTCPGREAAIVDIVKGLTR